MKLKDTCSLGRKATDKLSITRSRDITANKGPYNQSYGFSSSHVWMGELNYKEGWVLKNWCFPMVVLEKPLESPLDSKEIKPVNLKEKSLERLMMKLQYFGHLVEKANPLEKTLMLGKTEGRSRRQWQRMRRLDGVIDSMDTSLSKLGEMVKDREASRAAVHGLAKRQTQLSDWTTKG